MSDVMVLSRKQEELTRFLELNNFVVEGLSDEVLKVTREQELPVFLHVNDGSIFFEVDLGNMKELEDKDLYFKLLDMNTEILPVSFGVDNTNPDDARLVLVESRETSGLDGHELLSVFDAMELAVDKAEALLAEKMQN